METRLTVRIDGPGVRPGRIALKDLQRIVHPLEQALRALMPRTEPSSTKGGAAKQPDVRLLLSGIGEGSAIADLELDTDVRRGLPQMESDPIPALMASLQEDGAPLPPEAAQPIARLTAKLPEGVDIVELAYPDLEHPILQVQIVRTDAIAPASSSVTTRTISGRLAAVNFARGRARLQIPSTSRRRRKVEHIQLRFGDELAADMQRCARQLVSVQGEATVSPIGELQALTVQRVWVEFDDRRSLWPAKRFRWPTLEERLDNVDVDDFLRNIHGVDEKPE